MPGNPDSTQKSHATGDSIVPQKLQEKLPESVERAVPNAIHDTGDKSAKGAYQADKQEAMVQKDVKSAEHNSRTGGAGDNFQSTTAGIP